MRRIREVPTESGRLGVGSWVGVSVPSEDARVIRVDGYYARPDSQDPSAEFVQPLQSLLTFALLQIGVDRVELRVTLTQEVLLPTLADVLEAMAGRWPDISQSGDFAKVLDERNLRQARRALDVFENLAMREADPDARAVHWGRASRVRAFLDDRTAATVLDLIREEHQRVDAGRAGGDVPDPPLPADYVQALLTVEWIDEITNTANGNPVGDAKGGRPGGSNAERDAEIYRRRTAGLPPKQLAKQYRISVSRVQQIVRERRARIESAPRRPTPPV
jgi:hypothetical protein